MTASLFDRRTIAFYQANARSYASARPDEVTPELLHFLDRLPAGARILELGCGNGCDAEVMMRRGFVVDASDGTPAMAAVAGERLGRAVAVLRFDELDEIERYDAVVACASLLHVPRAGLAGVLARIWRALEPGGWHFASYKTAEAEGWDAHDRYYNYLARDDAEGLYRQGGVWAEIHFEEFDGVGYLSTSARWLTVTARKVG